MPKRYSFTLRTPSDTFQYCKSTGPFRYVAALLVVVVFFPLLGFDFATRIDDGVNVLSNPHLRADGSTDWWAIWTRPYEGLFIPVVYSTWAAVASLSRTLSGHLDPFYFHALNLLLHTANTAWVLRIFLQLGVASWSARIGTLLFALHPMQVEPVAWVTGTKDCLTAFFCLAAVNWFLVLSRRPLRGAEWAAIALVWGLATLSKPSAILLPFFLAMIARLAWKTDWRKLVLPLVASSIFALPLITLTQRSQWTELPRYVTPWHLRPLIALDSIGFYVSKIFVPTGLAFDLGRAPDWVLSNPTTSSLFIFAAFALVLGVLAGRHPWLRLPAAWIVIWLLPVLGFVPFQQQSASTVTCRYFYLPMAGAALGLSLFLEHARHKKVVVTLVLLWAVAWLPFTSLQIFTWKNDHTLMQHAVDVNPRSWASHAALGDILVDKAEVQSAIAHYQQAVKWLPEYQAIHEKLGVLLRASQPQLSQFHAGEASRLLEAYRARTLATAP